MRISIPKEESETSIGFDDTNRPVVIYTHNAPLKRRLAEYAKNYPEYACKTNENAEGGVTYKLRKDVFRIGLKKPWSEERLEKARENGRRLVAEGKLKPPKGKGE